MLAPKHIKIEKTFFVGSELQKIINDIGITQIDLSIYLNVHPVTINRWIKNKVRMKQKQFFNIKQVLNYYGKD